MVKRSKKAKKWNENVKKKLNFNEKASLLAVPVYWKAMRGPREAPPAGIILGTNETEFMESFTMSPFR